MWKGTGADDGWRVVRVPDADFPAFYRVIATPHVREFSDLSPLERARCMELVLAVEEVLRHELAPTKINLASLGNAVPHLHWHVIARFDWDSHFPQPVWGLRQRDVVPGALDHIDAKLAGLDALLVATLSAARRAESPFDAKRTP